MFQAEILSKTIPQRLDVTFRETLSVEDQGIVPEFRSVIHAPDSQSQRFFEQAVDSIRHDFAAVCVKQAPKFRQIGMTDGPKSP